MTIQQAVADMLADDPAVLRIDRSKFPPTNENVTVVGKIDGIYTTPLTFNEAIALTNDVRARMQEEPPVHNAPLCKCCAISSVWKDDLCFECAAHGKIREEDNMQLKNALARGLLFLKDMSECSENFDERVELDILIDFIETECQDE